MSSVIHNLIKEKEKWDNLYNYLRLNETPCAPSVEKFCVDLTGWSELLGDIMALCRTVSDYYGESIAAHRELNNEITETVAAMRQAARLGVSDD